MTQKKGFIKLPFQHGMLIGNDQTISNIDIEMTVQGIDEVENGYPNIMSVVLNDKSGFKDREVFEHALTNAYDGKLDAEFKSCYWGEMAIRYHQKNRKFGILIGVVDSSLVLGYISLIENPIVLAIIGGVTGLAVLIHNQLKWSEIIKNTRKKNEDWGEIKHKYYSLYKNTTGSWNTAIGDSSLFNNTTGTGNTTLGSFAGFELTTGHNNTLIGMNSQPSSPTVSTEITLGNSLICTLRCQVDLTVLSDARDKKNISDLSFGLDFLKKIKPGTNI